MAAFNSRTAGQAISYGRQRRARHSIEVRVRDEIFVGEGFSLDAVRHVAEKASWMKPFPSEGNGVRGTPEVHARDEIFVKEAFRLDALTSYFERQV